MAWRRINKDEFELVSEPNPHFDIDMAKDLLKQMKKASPAVRKDTIYEPWIEALRNWPNIHITFDLIWPLSGWLDTSGRRATVDLVKQFFELLFYGINPVRLSGDNNVKPSKDGKLQYEEWLEKVINHPLNRIMAENDKDSDPYNNGADAGEYKPLSNDYALKEGDPSDLRDVKVKKGTEKPSGRSGGSGSERHESNSRSGCMGEQRVFSTLKKDPKKEEVKGVSKYAEKYDGTQKGDDSLGYDIEYLEAGEKYFVEVKSTTGNERHFYISLNEIEKAIEKGSHYKIIFVTHALSDVNARMFVLGNSFIAFDKKNLDFQGGNGFQFIPTEYEIINFKTDSE
jgi:hypothetical protein